MKSEVAGLSLDGELEGIPLSAVVIIKIMDDEGDVAYVCQATEDLSIIEALGMVRYADIELARGLA